MKGFVHSFLVTAKNLTSSDETETFNNIKFPTTDRKILCDHLSTRAKIISLRVFRPACCLTLSTSGGFNFHPTKGFFPLPTRAALPCRTSPPVLGSFGFLGPGFLLGFCVDALPLPAMPTTPLRSRAQRCSSSRGPSTVSAPISAAPQALAQPLLGHVCGCVCVGLSVPPGTRLAYRERSANFCSSSISSFWPCLEIQWSTPCRR